MQRLSDFIHCRTRAVRIPPIFRSYAFICSERRVKRRLKTDRLPSQAKGRLNSRSLREWVVHSASKTLFAAAVSPSVRVIPQPEITVQESNAKRGFPMPATNLPWYDHGSKNPRRSAKSSHLPPENCGNPKFLQVSRQAIPNLADHRST